MTDMLYQKLDAENQEIRLLQILPGTEGSLVRCALRTARLADCTFDTLSYCWGAPGGPSKVILDTLEVPVNANLNSALRHLRKCGIASSKPIWIDALCINQHDAAERGSQVALMGTIFREATTIHLWLGTAAQVSLGTMEALQDKSNISQEKAFTGRVRPGLAHSPEQQAQHLHSFAQNPYWQRTWVMQEATLAKTCIIHGHDTYVLLHDDDGVSSSVLYPFLSPLLSSRGRAMLLPVVTAGFAATIRAVAHEPAFVRLLPEIFRCFRSLLASDPRDKVYGILGILPTTLSITPDYTKSVRDVYIEITIEIIKATRSLIVLNDAWSGRPDLPSWVPDMRRPGHSQGLLANWYASAGVPADIRVVGDGVLATKGLFLDTVAAVEEGTAHFAGSTDIERWQAFLDRFLARGHVAEREMGAMSSHLHKLMHGDKQHQEDFKFFGLPDHESKDISQVFQENDLFTTTAGRIGNAPRGHAKSGDQLVILAGATAPFLTTPATSASVDLADAITLKAPGILWDTFEKYDARGSLDGHEGEVMSGAWVMRKAGLQTNLDVQDEVGQQAVLDLFGNVFIC